MFLLILPNEILYQIWSEIHPEDIANFLVTCKSIYQLSGAALRRYRDHRRLYSQLDLVSPQHEHFLKAITQIPEICAYRTSVSFKPFVHPGTSDTSKYREFSRPHLKTLFTHIDLCRYIPPRHKKQWQNAVYQGDGGTLVALLLISLPNLRTLKLPYLDISEFWHFHPMMKSVVSDSEGSGALKFLSRVDLSPSRYRPNMSYLNSLSIPALFAALPSMRILIENENRTEWSLDGRELPRNGCIDISIKKPVNSFEFISFFTAIKHNLRSFSYWWPITAGQRYRWRPKYILEGLQPFRASLEQLTLVSNQRIYNDILAEQLRAGNDILFVGSLHEFVALKSLTIDSWLLLRGTANWEAQPNFKTLNNRLVDLLPSSCEELVLRTCQYREGAQWERYVLEYERIRSQFEGLREEKLTKLPRLRNITIQTHLSPIYAPWLAGYNCPELEIRVEML